MPNSRTIRVYNRPRERAGTDTGTDTALIANLDQTVRMVLATGRFSCVLVLATGRFSA